MGLVDHCGEKINETLVASGAATKVPFWQQLYTGTAHFGQDLHPERFVNGFGGTDNQSWGRGGGRERRNDRERRRWQRWQREQRTVVLVAVGLEVPAMASFYQCQSRATTHWGRNSPPLRLLRLLLS